jgi:hypothetical protein
VSATGDTPLTSGQSAVAVLRPRRPSLIGRIVDSVESITERPAAALILLVGLSTLVRAAISFGVRAPAILPDEIVYSELAKSIAEGTRPSIRGVPVFGWGEVYPTLIAPAWVVFDDMATAYRAALVMNGLVMSLAAIPAYLLARLFVDRRASLLVALATVLVPSMSYTRLVMTENAAYPAFVLAVLLIARVVRTPTAVNQALALLGVGILTFTRIQGMALAAAYMAAVATYAATGRAGERMSYLRRFVWTGAVLLALSVAPFVVSFARGEGVFGWLGARSGTFDGFHPGEIPRWAVYLIAGLLLYVAVVPAAASVVVIGRGLSRTASESARLFAAIALPVFVTIVGSMSVVSASFDVDLHENLNERYVFYVVPLLFVGLALWISEGLPRPRRWVWVLTAVLCALTMVLPIHRLAYNAFFQSVALLPWLEPSLSRAELALLVGAFTLACALMWIGCRRERAGLLWLLIVSWMAVAGVLAVERSAQSSSYFAKPFAGVTRGWVDAAVPNGTSVPVIWDQRVAPDSPDGLYFSVMVTELFNRSVGDVYRIGPPTYYEDFLPSTRVGVRRDGTLVDARGRPLAARYVLLTCRTSVQGEEVTGAGGGSLQLVKADRPIRLAGAGSCGH